LCAKAKLAKTVEVGKLTLRCTRVAKFDRWEKLAVTSTSTTVLRSTSTTMLSIPTLYSPAGNLYRAGEFCPAKDLRMLDHGSTGVIKCIDDNGYDRWVYP
jgi:hypothetical protein